MMQDGQSSQGVYRKTLLAGSRFSFPEGKAAVRIVSGQTEVYAVSCREVSYCQVFLLSPEAGRMVFAPLDEFDRVGFFLYAVEDTVVEIWSMEELMALPAERQVQIRQDMHAWFGKLIQLSEFKFLADSGDDMLSQWRQDDFLLDAGSFTDVWQSFREHEQILSMLLGARFHAGEKNASAKLEVQHKQRQKFLNGAVNLLMTADDAESAEFYTLDDKRLDEVTYIVRRIGQALRMPVRDLHLPPEITKKLDPLGLVRRLMQKGGMRMRLVSLKGEWYKKDCGVLLVCAGPQQQLAVLVPAAPGHYRMVNKDFPDGQPFTAGMAAELSGDAFCCYAGFPAKRLGMRDLLLFMLHQCWRGDYVTILMVSLFAGILPLCTPIVTETIFQDIIPIQDRQGLATVTQVIMIAGFTTAALSLVRSIAVMRISMNLDMSTEAALWSRLLSLPTKFFRKFEAGELLQRMQGIEAVKSLASGVFVSGVFNCLFSFWSLLLMGWYSLKLTVAALAVWGVYFIVVAFIYRRIFFFQRNMIRASNKTAGRVQQIFTGLAKFRIQGAEAQAYYLWAQVFGEEWKWNLKLRWQGNYNAIIGGIQPFILTLLLYYMALYGMNTMTAAGQPELGMTYAEFMGFQAAFSGFNTTLVAVIPLAVQIFGVIPHLENLRPVLDELPEISEDKVEAGALSGAMEVSHLTFGYRNEGVPVLRDVSFSIRAGECVAIVGRSGCGKSTLMRLLLGFETPQQGAVYYDGQELASLDVASVRCQMGVVLQNGQLMSGDIFTNIVGTSTLTMEDAWLAAERVGIAEDIREMPMGMHTMISEGSNNISGGQRQRLLLARAIANQPTIMILDEATSALDNRTQAIVTKSLQAMRCTRIIVAHRLTTIQDADRILVLDGGCISEQGTYAELMARDGLFSRLAKRQTA